MDIASLRALRTPSGQALLSEAAAADVSEDALLATASRLRERHDPALVSAALTQARLRVRARAKFGADAERMYFTQAGLEQSTRASVAAYRAGRFADRLPGARVLDLGCGIGADLVSRARAGLAGEGVELDPLTAEVAQANVTALGLDGLASVRLGDATNEDPSEFGAAFADPGRRTARGRVFDPRAYEPPLDVVLDMAAKVPAACVKVAPGIPHEAVPDGAEAEWVSVGGDVKEAALWLGELAGDVGRRATLLSSDLDPEVWTLTPQGFDVPDVRGWGRYLYEPDGAVIRAHLVGEVAELVGGGLADPHIAYITSDELRPTPFASAYAIEDVLPFSVKRLRAELRRREIGVLTVKKRGSAVDVDRLRHDLGFGRRRAGRGAKELTLVVTRVGRDPVALLTHPVAGT
ncbi:THUMP-like domain-containing protein [Actinomadura madurae]|uniref:THUMP-like domain-containing protein n=1 Tax=Actinomadura madurae TaxID=1993 RepID=UPI0020268961|nr:SAM-dependent methyltransferase [Actinomadura madurae]MCP9953074.1 SAM-dependent methyltransferase [Actinomadura madurae]MCP9969841.1 SAM-dependent methyltransferase [Actinomadura madurae]MCP9982293.1 SAM-dependent methyltransferase [Actinomadura madurae]MCQ0006178.1 SAM-dependent methyltransferase [Actinomadura madurae]URM98551.1 SAM-dependent methyltransferase [Actinomadura madurae]